MNAEHLLVHFNRVADSPDAVSRLRRFVLNLAVRGKLVERNLADEPVSELLNRTITERRKLLRKNKLTVDQNGLGETPHRIPKTWQWTLLGEIGDWGAGATPSRANPDFFGGGITWLKSGELNDNMDLIGSEETVTQLAIDKCSFRINRTGDILVAMYGATIGKLAILGESAVTNQAVCGCTPFRGVFNKYLFLFLLSQRKKFLGQGKGGAQPNISKSKIVRTSFPLPPLDEQHRIVKKVDELMALCDRFEKTRAVRKDTRDRLTRAGYARLCAFGTEDVAIRSHTRFVIDALPALTARVDQIKLLRSTILDLAVRGKLVEQEPTDEPASSLLKRLFRIRRERVKNGELRPHKRIPAPARDEEIFELPRSWVWCVADNVWDFENGDRSSNYPSRDQLVSSGVPFINAGHLVKGRVSMKEMNYITHDKFETLVSGKLLHGDQLYCLRGSLGKHAVFDSNMDAAIASSLVILRPVMDDCVPYLFYYLDSKVADNMLRRFDNGSAQPNLSSSNLRRFEIPFPPLAEQHRIVAKVDKLMALCDRLEANLSIVDTYRHRLLVSLFKEALDPTVNELEATA